MSRKTITILLLFVVLFVFYSCDSSKSYDNINIYEETVTNKSVYEELTFSTTETTVAPSLSDNCDIVLCCGYDENDCFFELVANEYEDYTGTTIEVGVIKDNQWVIEMTTDSPFIGKNGLFTDYDSISDIKVDNDFVYIGNGCFEHDQIVFNGNNGKSFNMKDEIDFYCFSKKRFYQIDCNQRNNILLLERDSYKKNTYYILNTLTMEYTQIPQAMSSALPYNDGLYAAEIDFLEGYAFYNINGEKVIDLSQYHLATYAYEHLIFSNGQCTFEIINDQGSEYEITIDKTGKVINSAKTS